MSRLTNRDVQSILKLLQELLTPCTLETFAGRLFSTLPQVVPSELADFSFTNFQAQQISEGWLSTNNRGQSIEVANQRFAEHPFAQHYFKTRDGRAHSLSDLVTPAQLHRIEGLYQQVLRPMGVDDQMVTILPRPAIAQTSQHEDIVLALYRSRTNFSDRDRLVLNLLRPHLRQAYENAQAQTQIQQALAQLNQTIEPLNLIVLNRDGQVQRLTDQTWAVLMRYFQPVIGQSRCLPETLQRWVNYQIAQLTQQNEILQPCFPLQIEQGDRKLSIRLIPDLLNEQYLLLLEEQRLTPMSATTLEWLGLTKREAEVLFWVMQDQSDSEIASILQLSSGTVKKHLEHIYQKFDVHTRTGAVMYALKHLGLFR